jgi:hypothetical protein
MNYKTTISSTFDKLNNEISLSLAAAAVFVISNIHREDVTGK